jgi:hypothetical protein
MLKPYNNEFHSHKSRAKWRGIEFEFTYDTWIEWWGDDITKRGSKKGQLVMARKGDQGPYHPDNVFKLTQEENASMGHKGKIVSEQTREKMSIAQQKRFQTEKQ